MIIRLSKHDTLQSVAQRYHTTVQSLMQTNGLASDAVYEGMRVLVHGYVVLPLAPYRNVDEFCTAYCVDTAAVQLAQNGLSVRVRV